MKNRSGLKLVVFAVVGLLVGILLPAVQTARESARRTACVIQIQRTGLAVQAHHCLNGTFPSGVVLSKDLAPSPASVSHLLDGLRPGDGLSLPPGPDPLLDALCERVPNSLETHRQCSGRYPHPFGDRLDRRVTLVAASDDGSLPRIELIKARIERLEPCCRQCFSLFRFRCELGKHFLTEVDAFAPRLLHVLQHFVASKATGPWQKPTERVLRVALAPQRQTGLLIDILEVSCPWQQRADKRVQTALAADECG